MLLWNVWNFSLEFWGTRGKIYLKMMIEYHLKEDKGEEKKPGIILLSLGASEGRCLPAVLAVAISVVTGGWVRGGGVARGLNLKM